MKIEQIVFRADGNSSIGLGHLFRCIAVAGYLKDDYRISFVVKSSSQISVIPKAYNLVEISENVITIDEPKWLNDTFTTQNTLIIADGYEFTEDYQKAIKYYGFNLAYIDDLSSFHHYADAVINHSLNVRALDYSAEPYTKFFLGTNYAMLRPSFLKIAQQRRIIKKLDNVFICFGGADFNNLTIKCVNAILKIKTIKQINVVLGNAYKGEQIINITENHKTNVIIHRALDEKEMVMLMKKSQIAIVPTSTISYEACSAKMLILGGYYANNQINIYKGLKENNLIYAAGDFNELSEADIKDKVKYILDDTDKNKTYKINNHAAFFDGKSKERFLNIIKQLQ